MDETSTNKPIDLRDALRPVIARLWLIVVCVSVATALTYYHYSSQPKQYTASTSLYIGSNSPASLTNETSNDRQTTDLATLINSGAVAPLVAKELGLKGDAAGLAGSVTATPDSGSDFVTLTAISGNPQDAALLVNTVANAFVTNETNTIHQEAAEAISAAQRQLNALPNTLENATQRSQLDETVQQMETIEYLPTAGIEHVSAAVPPSTPFSPDPKKNAIFAFAITLLLTIAGAYGLDRLDRRFRRLTDLEKAHGQPVLAAIPRTPHPVLTRDDGTALLPDDVREAFRRLRTSVELAAIDRPAKTIAITSAVPREGKSTITRNLALAYREAGLHVCVIDADLRRHALGRLLNVDEVPGLTDVVVGEESLSAVLAPVAAGIPGLSTLARLKDVQRGRTGLDLLSLHGSRMDANDPRGVGSLAVLPAGSDPANPPVVLGSDQMRSILASLADEFDIILIDTSPLLVVSDAVPLLSAADGVLVVSRLGMSTSDAAEDLNEQLRRVPGANVLGVVANDVHGRHAAGQKYVYGDVTRRVAA